MSFSEVSVSCPPYTPFIGFAGIFLSISLSVLGAAYGTSKSGISIAGLAQSQPEKVMRSLIPVVMAGIIAVYGLVISVLISSSIPVEDYSLFAAFIHLAAGLASGMTGLSAGWAIGKVGQQSTLAFGKETRTFVGSVLILIFAEVLGLYGLIVALL